AVHFGARGRSQPPTDPYGPLFPRTIAHLGGAHRLPVSIALSVHHSLPDLEPIGPAERAEAAVAGLGEPSGKGGVSLPEAGQALIRVVRGRIVAGLVEFAVTAPHGVVLGFHYTAELAGRRGPVGAHGGNRYVARGRDDTHRVLDKEGFREAY